MDTSSPLLNIVDSVVSDPIALSLSFLFLFGSDQFSIKTSSPTPRVVAKKSSCNPFPLPERRGGIEEEGEIGKREGEKQSIIWVR